MAKPILSQPSAAVTPDADNPPPGADPAAWRRYCEAAQRLAAQPKRKRTKRSRRTASKRLQAATRTVLAPTGANRQREATGAATLELVERVNERHESILVNLPDGWKVVA